MQFTSITSSTPYNHSSVPHQTVEVSSSNAVSEVAKMYICNECQKEVAKTFNCSQCKRVTYCGPECQKTAWKAHKIACQNKHLIPTNNELVSKFINTQGVVCDITQAEYQKMTNSTFVTNNLYPKKLLNQTGTDSKKETHTVSDVIAIKYEGDKMGYGIVALKNIQSGQSICTLGGEISRNEDGYYYDRTERQRLYTLQFGDYDCDASIYSGLGSLINDGIPNVDFEVKQLTNSKEPFEVVVKAIRNIKAGEFLYIDYGAYHPVKSQFYQMNYESFQQLVDRYSEGLDFSHEYISRRSKELKISELQVECELKYICHTPHVIALFHLLSKIDPLKTLMNLDNMPKVLRGSWYSEESLISIPTLLKGIANITENARDDFVNLVNKISGNCLRIVCTTLNNLKSFPPMQDLEKYAILVEKHHLLFYASFNHTYEDWSELEKWEFIKKFLTSNHQNKVLNVSEIKSLPKELQTEYLLLKNIYIKKIIKLIADECLDKLSPEQMRLFFLLKYSSS